MAEKPPDSKPAPVSTPQPQATNTSPSAQVSKSEEPQVGTKWSHRTIDDFLSNNTSEPQLRDGAPDKDKSKQRMSLTRTASKKLMAKVQRGEDPGKTNNEEGKLEIEMASAWKSTHVDWRAEDDFGDDADAKKKKKWGIKKIFGRKK